MKAAAVCLPDSQYNPEIGDTPSHRGALTHQRVSRLQPLEASEIPIGRPQLLDAMGDAQCRDSGVVYEGARDASLQENIRKLPQWPSPSAMSCTVGLSSHASSWSMALADGLGGA